jgi:MtN3 and saliva related transmembrane protein
MPVSVTELIGVAAMVVLVTELMPQSVRLWRTKSVSGLSSVGTGIYFVTEMGWIAYGITSGLVIVLASALVVGFLSAVQLALVWPHRQSTDIWWMALWATALAAALAFGAIGSMLVIGLIVGLGPQAWAAWRAPVVHGVSVWRWVLTATSGGLWFTYGILLGAFPLIATGSVGMVCASLALSRSVADAMGRVRTSR